MPKLKKKIPSSEKGRVSSSDRKGSADELSEKMANSVSKVSFDPNELVHKIIKFGVALTGIELYKYQYDPVYRVLKSIITFEGASVTLLTARQCIVEGSIVHTRDGKLVPIDKHPKAWKTSDSEDAYRLTSYLGHSMSGTKDHEIYTSDGWKVIEEINPGDEIACLVAWDKFPKSKDSILYHPEQELHTIISGYDKESLRDFLSQIYKNVHDADFSAPTLAIAETIRELLNKMGFPALVEEKKRATHREFIITFLAQPIRKGFLNWLSSSNSGIRVPHDFIGDDGELYKFAPVAHKEYLGKKPVWDMEVPEKGWFTVGGIMSHNCGKSESIAFIAVTCMVLLPKLGEIFSELEQFTSGFKVGVFAPQSDQVDNLYNRIKSRIGSDNAAEILADPDIDTGITSLAKMTLTNGSVCSAQTASKTSKIEGLTLDFAVVDEAQDIDQLVATKSIEPMLTSTGGTMLRCGTTSARKNNFYDEIQYNRREDLKVKSPLDKNHFEYDWKSIVRYRKAQHEKDGKEYHLRYERDVLKKKKKWGEKSEAFKLSYALVWTLDSGMFCTDARFWKLCNKRMNMPVSPEEGKRYDFGIDWAKENCSTVVTIIEVTPSEEAHDNVEDYEDDKPLKKIVGWYELGDTNYEYQHGLIMELVHIWTPTYVCADATGVGAGPTDRLAFAVPVSTTIIPFVFSRQSKSDMWQDLESDMKNDRITVPCRGIQDSEEFMNFYNQMTSSIRYYAGVYLVVHKGAKGYDDYVDSLGLAVQAGNMDLEVEETIDEDVNFLYGGNGTMSIYERIYNNAHN